MCRWASNNALSLADSSGGKSAFLWVDTDVIAVRDSDLNIKNQLSLLVCLTVTATFQTDKHTTHRISWNATMLLWEESC